jgi:hypothetical protein
MPNRPHHRKLADQLQGWDSARLATLLQRRPDLARPDPPLGVVDLAQRAQAQRSIREAISHTNLPENRILQVVVCCRPSVPLDELERALPEGVRLADVDEHLTSLEDAALVWRHDGRLHCSGALRQVMPTKLGPLLHDLVEHQSVDFLRHAISLLRAGAGRTVAAELPPPASGQARRPPKKADLVDEVAVLLRHPGLVDDVLADAPVDARMLAHQLAEGQPTVSGLLHDLYWSRGYRNRYVEDLPEWWLFERALLLPGHDRSRLPREVGLALRGGRPVEDLALDRPALAVGAAGAAGVDRAAASRAADTMHRLADLLERWEHVPVKALKSGGLGATARKQVATLLDCDQEEAGRIIELAYLAGLLTTVTRGRKEGRRPVYDDFVRPSPAAGPWLDQPLETRWASLAAAWLRAERWPSTGGRKVGDAKATPLLDPYRTATAPQRRREVLDLLASLDPGTSTTADVLVERVYWEAPQVWLDAAGDEARDAVRWVLEEAELLGMAASGALSAAGRAVLAGDVGGAQTALREALPEPVRTFTLQADHTATVVGDLPRDILVDLRLLADLESSGHASTWRFSEGSLRRALDVGWDAARIHRFLEQHAAKGVPKPLAFLVDDVARRHGHLRVGAASCVVTSDDPAVLADACSHRRTRKFGLRLVAPTVAISAQPPGKVTEGLRSAGFLPTADDEPATGAGAGRDDDLDLLHLRTGPQPSEPGELPEPFRHAPLRSRGPAPLAPQEAAELAAAVLAAPPAGDTRFEARAGRSAPPSPPSLDLDADLDDAVLDDLADLDQLLSDAWRHDRAVAVLLGDGTHDPLVLAISEWSPGRAVGIDLTDGGVVSLLTEHIVAAVDLGPLDEVAGVAPMRRSPGRPRRRRR